MQNEVKEEIHISALNIIIRVAVFLLIGFVIIQLITPIFIPKWASKYGGVTRRIKGIYTEKEDTIDVVILGNSDAYKGFSTMKLWENHGITSYHLGTPKQTTWTSYYLLKEMYKYQKPKLVIIETDYLFEKKDRSEPELRKVYDNMKFSINKLQAINDPAYKNSLQRKLSYLFPILRFHSRWSEINVKEAKTSYQKYEAQFKGYEFTKQIKPYQHDNDYLKKKNKPNEKIPEKSAQYLDKIIELCKENNTQVLLVEVPSASSWSYKKGELVTEFAQQRDLEFIDFNMNYKQIGFDWKTDTEDEGNHLNVYGAEKISTYIGSIIAEKYQLENHRDDEKYAKWHDYFKIYEERK